MADYTISAELCTVAKQGAPNLKIMVSKGARPEIAENPTFPKYAPRPYHDYYSIFDHNSFLHVVVI